MRNYIEFRLVVITVSNLATRAYALPDGESGDVIIQTAIQRLTTVSYPGTTASVSFDGKFYVKLNKAAMLDILNWPYPDPGLGPIPAWLELDFIVGHRGDPYDPLMQDYQLTQHFTAKSPRKKGRHG